MQHGQKRGQGSDAEWTDFRQRDATWDNHVDRRVATGAGESPNEALEAYYKRQKIVPEDEWGQFLDVLQAPLPIVFRVNGSGPFARALRRRLDADFFAKMTPDLLQADGAHARAICTSTAIWLPLASAAIAAQQPPSCASGRALVARNVPREAPERPRARCGAPQRRCQAPPPGPPARAGPNIPCLQHHADPCATTPCCCLCAALSCAPKTSAELPRMASARRICAAHRFASAAQNLQQAWHAHAVQAARWSRRGRCRGTRRSSRGR